MLGSVVRPWVVRLANTRWFRWLATHRAVGWRVASRFVAGETLDQAFETVRELRDEGIAAMLDHLGESVETESQALGAAGDYIAAVKRIRAEPDVDCEISIKLSQLGLDRSAELCLAQVERILAVAEPAGVLVMIDMEAFRYVDPTLAMFRDLRGRHELVGLCLQASLRRTPSDILTLPEASVVRLVKGAYLEPTRVALHERKEVDASWAGLFTTLVIRGHTVHVATHDGRLVDGAIRVARDREIPRSHVEFQMLYGIRRDLQRRLVAEGRPVRVYVPYGSQWFPYLTRRLVERPANMWFFVSNVARRQR